jgi:hypothetical protein
LAEEIRKWNEIDQSGVVGLKAKAKKGEQADIPRFN